MFRVWRNGVLSFTVVRPFSTHGVAPTFATSSFGACGASRLFLVSKSRSISETIFLSSPFAP